MKFMITASFGAVIVLGSCHNSLDEARTFFYTPDKPVAAGQTYDFEAYYTLQGEVAMKMTSPESDEYPDFDFPRQIFPKGLYMEIYNKQGEKTTIRADKAVVYKKTGLVELIGNVVITGNDGSTLKTTRLFWDRMNEHIFTDEPIEFQRKDEYIQGIGFDSNMQFTTARVNNVKGIIKVKQKS